MVNFKYLDTHLTTLIEKETIRASEDRSMSISVITILNALKKYEIGIPHEYFERDGIYFGIASWLQDEEKKGNIVKVCENNTYDLAGYVSVHFGFAQYDSLISEDTFVLMHIHDGEPFLRESLWHNRYPAILFKFEKGTSFYNVLDDIIFENPDVPSMLIPINDKHYLVLPRVISESYFVKCLETGEELEPTNEIWFYGNEEDVKEQIENYIKMQKTLVPRIINKFLSSKKDDKMLFM